MTAFRRADYLDQMAKILGARKATLAVIDRDLADLGLRRKGKGRAIPFPTLQEDILLMLAVASRAPVRKAASAGYEWACKWRGGNVNSVRFADYLNGVCRYIENDPITSTEFIIRMDIERGIANIEWHKKRCKGINFCGAISEGSLGINTEVIIHGETIRNVVNLNHK